MVLRGLFLTYGFFSDSMDRDTDLGGDDGRGILVLLGYGALCAMGMTLGLIGSGGAILTIPILMFFFSMPIIVATRYAFLLVAATAWLAAFFHRRQILFYQSLWVMLPSSLAVLFARRVVFPVLPEVVWGVSLDAWLIGLLTVLIFLAGVFMVQNLVVTKADRVDAKSKAYVVIVSIVLGSFMGLLGAGGGFLIVPTLMFFLGLSIQNAVATSLMVVATNTTLGLLGDVNAATLLADTAWAQFLLCAWLGMFVGVYTSAYVSGEGLKKIFGFFLLGLGFFFLFWELIPRMV